MADMKSARREITKARRAARTQAKREFKLAPLSGVIRLAIADLEAVERSKKYVVNMDVWHEPRVHVEVGLVMYNPDTKVEILREMDETGASCAVCFAGAVMAHRFGASPNRSVCPIESNGFHETVVNRLDALNNVRMGWWDFAARDMGLDRDKIEKAVGRIRIPTYGPKTRSRFKIQLLKAATRLEKVGL